jgi:hypothetical protein
VLFEIEREIFEKLLLDASTMSRRNNFELSEL